MNGVASLFSRYRDSIKLGCFHDTVNNVSLLVTPTTQTCHNTAKIPYMYIYILSSSLETHTNYIMYHCQGLRSVQLSILWMTYNSTNRCLLLDIDGLVASICRVAHTNCWCLPLNCFILSSVAIIQHVKNEGISQIIFTF